MGGLTRCFHGFGIQMMRDIQASESYFVIFEWTYDQIMRRELGDKKGITASLLSGGMAGVLSWALIIPLDVVKSQVQADYRRERFTSAWQCAKNIYNTQGLKAFGTGFQACAVRAFIVNAVIFAIHKQSLELLNNLS